MRTCAICPTSIDHLRADARYCSDACRREAARRRSEGAGDPDVFWVGYARVRRPRRR
jgi:hypothetical protein